MKKFISRIANGLAEWSGSTTAVTSAFSFLFFFMVLGLVFGFTDSYQIDCGSFMSAVSFFMLFIIQHTQNADTRAVHRKLDAILEATKNKRGGNRE